MAVDVDAGIAAIVGGVLGIVGTLLGSSLNARHNARERKQDAYQSASRALLRVRNTRKRMLKRGEHELDRDRELQPYLQDLVEAQHALSMLLLVCGAKQARTLKPAVDKFDKLVDRLILRPDEQGITSKVALARVQEALDTLVTAQGDDLEAHRWPFGNSRRRRDAAKQA